MKSLQLPAPVTATLSRFLLALFQTSTSSWLIHKHWIMLIQNIYYSTKAKFLTLMTSKGLSQFKILNSSIILWDSQAGAMFIKTLIGQIIRYILINTHFLIMTLLRIRPRIPSDIMHKWRISFQSEIIRILLHCQAILSLQIQ